MIPLPPSQDPLPSSFAIADRPQLASLALLQSALRVVPISIDLHHPHLGAIPNLSPNHPDWPPTLLASLIVDRCRELSELVSLYRLLLDPPLEPQSLDCNTPF